MCPLNYLSYICSYSMAFLSQGLCVGQDLNFTAQFKCCRDLKNLSLSHFQISRCFGLMSVGEIGIWYYFQHSELLFVKIEVWIYNCLEVIPIDGITYLNSSFQI